MSWEINICPVFWPKTHPRIIGASDPESALMLGRGPSLIREKRQGPEQAWEVMRFSSQSATPVTRTGGHPLRGGRSSINSFLSANSDSPMSIVSNSRPELA